jgi:hypothetical protein
MQRSNRSVADTDPATGLNDVDLLLEEIEREKMPERLLELARQLQAALNERRQNASNDD